VKVGKQQMSITNLHKEQYHHHKKKSRQKFLGKLNVSYLAFFFCSNLLDAFLITQGCPIYLNFHFNK
jgi:hypothetical protein